VLAPRHFLRSPPRCPNCKAVVGPKVFALVVGIIAWSFANAFARTFIGTGVLFNVVASLLFALLIAAVCYFIAPLEVFPEPKVSPSSTKLERLYLFIAVALQSASSCSCSYAAARMVANYSVKWTAANRHGIFTHLVAAATYLKR
jgi:hypothetical protein